MKCEINQYLSILYSVHLLSVRFCSDCPLVVHSQPPPMQHLPEIPHQHGWLQQSRIQKSQPAASYPRLILASMPARASCEVTAQNLSSGASNPVPPQ